MGKQARIKRERRHGRHESGTQAPPGARTMVLTMPLPGAEHLADAEGHFDDCEVCRALRDGDEAGASEIMRKHPGRVDVREILDLDLAPFLAWMKAEGIDPDLD